VNGKQEWVPENARVDRDDEAESSVMGYGWVVGGVSVSRSGFYPLFGPAAVQL